jgi:tetratricopeptide (TPR) repeat protein
MSRKTKKLKKPSRQPDPPPTERTKRFPYFLPLLLLLILSFTAIVYSGSLKNDFVNWDDKVNVYENPLITEFSAANLHAFFTKPLVGMYTPLVYLSFALDYRWGGLSPQTYHLTNLFLHLVNVVLVFMAVRLLVGKTLAAALAALLFAVHPVNVDGVAHISTRSNLLSCCFYLSAFIFYLSYVASPRRRLYFLSILSFLLAALAKSSAVTLPLLLLLADYFNKRKFSARTLLEKIPFFAIALLFGILTLIFRRDIDLTTIFQRYSLADRFFLGSYSLAFYLVQFFAPFDLSAYHPYPMKSAGLLPLTFYLSPGILLLWIWGLRRAKAYRPVLLFGSLFYLIHMVLVLKVIPIGSDFVADRYAYLPYIGFFLVLGQWGCRFMEGASPQAGKMKPYAVCLVAALVVILSYASYSRTKVWKDSLTLWNDVLRKYPSAALAYNNRGDARMERKEYGGAIEDFTRAITIQPRYTAPIYNRGLARIQQKDYAGALDDFTQTLAIDPRFAAAYYSRGLMKAEMKDYPRAIAEYTQTLSADPQYVAAYYNRGLARLEIKDYRGAIEDFTQTVAINPQNASAYFYRALAKWEIKDDSGAAQDTSQAAAIDPRYSKGFYVRVMAKIETGDYQGAIADCTRIIQLDPQNAEAFHNRGFALSRLQRHQEALRDYDRAIQLDFRYGKAYQDRAVEKETLGDTQGALQDYTTSLQLQPDSRLAYTNRGKLRGALKDYGGAAEDFTKAIQLAPNDPSGYRDRGYAKMGLDDNPGALEDFTKALQLAPEAGTYFARGTLRFFTQDVEGAVHDFNRVIELQPNHGAAYLNRGLAQLNLGKDSDACRDLQTALGLGVRDASEFLKRYCR